MCHVIDLVFLLSVILFYLLRREVIVPEYEDPQSGQFPKDPSYPPSVTRAPSYVSIVTSIREVLGVIKKKLRK